MAIAVDLVHAASRPVVVCGTGLRQSDADPLRKIESKAKFIALVSGVNTLMTTGLGLNERFDPADCATLFVAAADEGDALDQAAARLRPSAFLIVMACFTSALTERADLVLPTATWLERSGTFTGTDGTRLRAHAALPPSGQSRSDWDILGRLAERLGLAAGTTRAELPRCGA
jgi:NADH dehydrogenase/NADH:ubiquinone oxidoreductase subunit G